MNTKQEMRRWMQWVAVQSCLCGLNATWAINWAIDGKPWMVLFSASLAALCAWKAHEAYGIAIRITELDKE